MYSKYDDEIPSFNGNHKLGTFELLVENYLPFIRKRAFYLSQSGVESEELVQEGLMGLLNATKYYNSNRDVSFKTYATHCINNKMISIIRLYNTSKSMPMRNFVSLSDEDLENIVFDNSSSSQDPQEIYVKNEELQNNRTLIFSTLSAFEKEIIKLYLSGYSYKESSKILSCPEKSIDNALQRIKFKLRNIKN